jgi:anaerobic selenocysteine-containing dehydrogenase
VLGYSPEAMAPVCGIPAETIREVARAYATAKASMILWGMGVSQHVHGTDNARCLIALASITGQIGRPGTGLHPLRGQNNVQGASDAGLIPMMYPNYQRVDNAGRTPGSSSSGASRWMTARLHRGRDHAQGPGARQPTRTRCAACTSWARTRP